MLKRRDWLHLHGEDGSGSSDDDDSGRTSSSDRAGSSSEEEGERGREQLVGAS